jgi:hypothetical protein
MPKKIFAVTNIKVGSGPGEFVAAGSEIDSSLPAFNKKTLLELHSQGAIEVRVVDEEPVAVEESTETTDGEMAPDGKGSTSSETSNNE